MSERERDDADLTDLLARKLPQYAAPLALKRALAEKWEPAPAPKKFRLRRVFIAPALVAAMLLLVGPFAYDRAVLAPARAHERLVTEAVNDHVRVMQQPLGVASGGQHEVKPWFTGRLDFAPSVGFMGDEEFPLKGGAVGYYVDRPAAVLEFGRRRHTISLLIFRADGLSLPTRPSATMQRGFNVMLWRAGEFGYALVSDVDRADLVALQAKL